MLVEMDDAGGDGHSDRSSPAGMTEPAATLAMRACRDGVLRSVSLHLLRGNALEAWLRRLYHCGAAIHVLRMQTGSRNS